MKWNRTVFILTLLTGCVAVNGIAWGSSSAEISFREGYKSSMARQWSEAVMWFTQAIEEDPENPEAYFQRAVAFEMMDRLDEAVSDYEATLQLKPDYYLAMEYLAKLYEKIGDYPRALELYQRALSVVKNEKWRSIVKWWISEARKKMKAEQDKDKQRTSRRRH